MEKEVPRQTTAIAGVAEDGRATTRLKLDRNGLPLVPQPSDHPDDPLNWPYWLKVYVVLIVSGLAFTSQMGSALINPAFVQMAKDLDVTVEQASYSTTIYILFNGIFPMFMAPLANVYGRRWIYIIFTLIAFLSQVGSGVATTYGGVITGRVFYGIGGSISVGLGAATICDVFTQGERGLYMGIYAFCINNGPHIAPVIGGYIALRLSWPWCFYIPAMITAGFWVAMIFTFPETLFSRHDFNNLPSEGTPFASKLSFHGKVLDRDMHLRTFVQPYRMMQYWAVVLPSVYYMTVNAYGSAVFAVTGSHLGAALYKFNVAQTGLWMGLPLLAGCIVGESMAGWVSDLIINTYAKRHGGYRKPEMRLALMPLCVPLIAGVMAFGPSVQDKRAWIVTAVEMALAGFGSQIATTMVYTYSTDCYKPQAAEIGAVINFIKSTFAFSIGFYGLPFGETHGYNVSFPVLGALNAVALLPLIWLFFRGEHIRERQGLPAIHQDL